MKVFLFILLFFSFCFAYEGIISISAEEVTVAFVHKNGKIKINKYKGNDIPSVSFGRLKQEYDKALKEDKKLDSVADLELPPIFNLYNDKIKYCKEAGIKKLTNRNFITLEYRFKKPVQLVPMVKNELESIIIIKEGIEQEIKIPAGYEPVVLKSLNDTSKNLLISDIKRK